MPLTEIKNKLTTNIFNNKLITKIQHYRNELPNTKLNNKLPLDKLNNKLIRKITSNKIQAISLIVIILLSVGLSNSLRDLWADTIIHTDDVYYISSANSFSEGRDFYIDFHTNTEIETLTTAMPNDKRTAEYFQYFPDGISTPYGRMPVHFIVMGFFYWIADSTPENWYHLGSIVSTLGTVSFLLLLFLFSRKFFGPDIAIITVSIVAFTTITLLYSVRIFPYTLLFSFLMAAFLFTNKTKRDYILFGIFFGLAYMTSPLAILPGFAYLVFLLLKMEFRGFTIISGITFLILLPYFIRNIWHFCDFGIGFRIPFSTHIMNAMNIRDIVSCQFGHLEPLYLQFHEFTHPARTALFYESISGLFSLYFVDVFHVVTVGVVLLFSFFAFISFQGIRKDLSWYKQQSNRLKLYFIIIISTFLILLGTSYSLLSSEYASGRIIIDDMAKIQITLFLLLPVIGILLFYYLRRRIFVSSMPRIYTVIMLTMLISLFGYYFFALTGDHTIVELKVIMPAIWLAIPLGLFGIKRIIMKVLKSFEISNKNTVCFFIMMFLIIPPVLIEYVDGYSWSYGPETRYSRSESQSMQVMHSWIRENIPNESKVSSDFPEVTFLKTGLKSAGLPTYELVNHNVLEFDSFIKKYDISYIIMYYPHDTTIFDSELSESYSFSKIYQDSGDPFSRSVSRFYSIYQVDEITLEK